MIPSFIKMPATIQQKFDKYMFIGWSVAVFILLADIFNCMFDLFINNIVRELIIDDSLSIIFLILYKILFWRRRLILHGILGS